MTILIFEGMGPMTPIIPPHYMCHLIYNNLFQRGDRLYTSESDVCGRQILIYKDGHRTERIKIFVMAVRVDP